MTEPSLYHKTCLIITNEYLEQLCPTEIPFWSKNYATISMRAAHRMTWLWF